MDLNLNKFKNVKQCVDEASKNLSIIDPKRICEYPIDCLNDFLLGIIPSELIIIGGDTGTGKTELVNSIALHNSRNGKKVYLISLEGDKDEVINRWKWEIICREYYKNPTGTMMHYSLFVTNRIKGIEKLIEKADEELNLLNGNLEIFDREFEFTVDTLTQQMELIKDDAQLIIIDHLHYFSLFDEETEARQISKIMKTIKKLTEEYKIPIVLVSHLRKKNKDRGLGDNEDFMGSSNIAKVASTAIIMNPCYEMNTFNSFATIFRVTKNRAGMKQNIGFCTYYDIRIRQYLPHYDLVKITQDNKASILKEEAYPLWTKELIRYKKANEIEQTQNYQDEEENQ